MPKKTETALPTIIHRHETRRTEKRRARRRAVADHNFRLLAQ